MERRRASTAAWAATTSRDTYDTREADVQSGQLPITRKPYLVGSGMFLLGALIELWLWKSEQFGLGFIREINPIYKARGSDPTAPLQPPAVSLPLSAARSLALCPSVC